ncbi:unnamed protein product [Colias eurytheme]|nr:unnamed protein product [Colias eurytheme]
MTKEEFFFQNLTVSFVEEGDAIVKRRRALQSDKPTNNTYSTPKQQKHAADHKAKTALHEHYAKRLVTFIREKNKAVRSSKSSPGSVASRVCGGCWLSGPGVPPEPGERTSSFTAPYDSEEEGGLC